MTGLVLDAGAFVGLEKQERVAAHIFAEARAKELPLVTSAAVVGQVWRGGARQAPIALVFKWPHVSIVNLTYEAGRIVGHMLATSETSDVIDAHVVLLASERQWPVVTSDPDDLRKIDRTLELWPV